MRGTWGVTGPEVGVVRGTWGVQVLEQGLGGVHRVNRCWSKGFEGCLGCTGPGARLRRGTWGTFPRAGAPCTNWGGQSKCHG